MRTHFWIRGADFGLQEATRVSFRPWPSLVVLALLAGFFVSGCGRGSDSGQSHEQTLYTCGMHPQVLQPKPGNCPICGMKLTPVRKPAAGSPSGTNVSSGERAALESSTIAIDAVTAQNMDLRTQVVTRGPLHRTVRTVGIVDFDETAIAEVSTKFRGWVEKLYIDATGQQMHRGDPLLEVYSPELFLAQTEYLLTLGAPTNTLGAETELRQDAAITKLRYWDISDDQIADLRRTGKPKKTMRINAPRDGTVLDKMVVQGQMVEAGMRLYRLADLATVWVQAQVYEQDLALIKPGQEALVSLSSQPDPKFRGRVTYIYPTVDEKTRTARVRLEFHNPGYFLKPGMYTTVEMTPELADSVVLVPDMAVLRSGEKNTVFVAINSGHFEPRTVVLGSRSDGGLYEVLSGLREGERVVTSGQFMLDSESQLREAIQKMTPAADVASPPQERSVAVVSALDGIGAKGAAAGSHENVYICPMPEHVSLEYDHPGKCPLCGMGLVPVTREMLSRIQPGQKVEYYTCPMAEHSDVHESRPGKCPRCGMTLIPVMVRPKAAPPRETHATTPLPAVLYTCPMAQHSDVVSDKPGVCPKCEMKLVETAKVSHGAAAEENWRKQHPEPGAAVSAMPMP